MKKHISGVELCDGDGYHRGLTHLRSDCERGYHKDDFCLLCNYEIEGERLYMEIHGPDGWDEKTRQVNSAQPYACMGCVGQFRAFPLKNYHTHPNKLIDFIKEGKK